ncbi:MAG: hypothetical protein KIS66_15705 [Fimbriimonadaceae bacterium]|nr:hypothetical protein [Fimbriimonadaceae bacterium]
MSVLLALPVLLPLVCAATAMLFWRRLRVQRTIAVLTALGHLASTLALFVEVRRFGILVARFGDWPAPYGIVFVADTFSGLMLVTTSIVTLAVTVYSLSSIDADRESFGFFPLVCALLMGVSGAFLTGDIFNLYVWFEVLLIASFVLMALGGERKQLEGALKYVTLNLVSSSIFLAGLGLLYGSMGTLNLAQLSVRVAEATDPGFVTMLAMFFLLAFGIKAALFPLYGWLPSSYHTPPTAVSALFAGLLTKVGVYALIRTFTLVFTNDPTFTHRAVLLGMATVTILAGSLGAIVQRDLRRALSFTIVASVGFAVLGLAVSGGASQELATLALAGTIAYVIQAMVVKTQVFLLSGIVRRLSGSFDVARIGGLYASAPGVAILFLLGALALAGVPPLPSFIPKVAVLRAAFGEGLGVYAGVALLGSLLMLGAVARLWSHAFWRAPMERPHESDDDAPVNLVFRFIPVTGLTVVLVLLGVGAGPVFQVATEAARQLLDTDGYVRAVLGGAR